jgi:O-antigen/teichoic acid export membrane protein
VTETDQSMPGSSAPDTSDPGRRARVRALVRTWFRDGSDVAIAKRMASTTFLLRVFNAAIALVLQVVLARWMGEHEYGIYAYTWVWVLLLGGLAGLGLSSASQRFIPQYTERGELDHLRGFLVAGWLLTLLTSGTVAALGALGITLFGAVLSPGHALPLLLACATVPIFVVSDFQESVARAYHWADVGFIPGYVGQPLLILAGSAALYLSGQVVTAYALMAISFAAVLIVGAGQLWALSGRVRAVVPAGPRRLDVAHWMRVAWPLLLLNGFYLILTYVDVLVLERFRPPQDVAHYYAATKIMAVMSFIVFAVQAATGARFAQYHVSGDRERLAAFTRTSVKWTLWPSFAAALGLLALGKPLLWLFGPGFMEVYYLLPIIAIGLLARAAVGPVDRLLAMAGEQNATAWVAGLVLVVNVVLNLALIPLFGLAGAAGATSLALMLQSAVLFAIARKRLGIALF